jgi:crotonobetainyl-CoA:carnitine CoA-transferase CaiB-like acyl-CoA transferase
MADPFRGIKILDFCQGIGGPMGCALMADLGADVVKVEPPGGDRIQDQPHYIVWNRNKRRITLDLTRDADMKAAKDLIAKANIAVFDHAPGALEAMGLDAGALRNDHPELIHVWAPPYGVSGPWSQLPADHLLLTSLLGSAFRQTSYSDQPVFIVTPVGFYGHGIILASAMCTALFERSRSGVGQGVVVGGLQGLQALQNAATGPARIMSGPGNPLGAGCGYRTYECADGKFLFLGALFAHFFTRTVATMGLDPVAVPREAASAPILAAKFKERPRAEWLELFLQHDVPAGPVITRKEWFNSGIVASNKMRVKLQHPEYGNVAMPGTPVEFSDTPASVRHLVQDAKLADIDWPPVKHTAPKEPPPVGEGPLAGVTVLDLGTVIAGAYATGVLTGLGANVIKIEPAEGDPFRSMTASWASYHRGKRALGLDLKAQEGRDLFFQLVKQADVVLDNYRIGVRKRLGIDYEALAKINPRIISCTINAYGANNDFTHLPGFDAVIQAHSGIMQAQGGEPDQEPVMNSMNINDVGSATIASMGVLAALYAREVTGRGQEVLTSLANVSCIVQSGEMVEYEGRPPNISGGRDVRGSEALHHLYQCGDGRWVAISAASESRFEALARALGHEDWIQIYKGRAVGADRDGALALRLADTLAALSAPEALTRLLEAGVPCAPALRAEESYDDLYLWENNVFDSYDSPRHGETLTQTRCLMTWERSRSGNYQRPSPELGEQSTDVLREFGINDRCIAELMEKQFVFGR